DIARLSALRVHGMIHPAHIRDGDPPAERYEGRLRLRVRKERGAPGDDRRIVRRKVALAVLEHRQLVGLDETAGRVAGDEVDLSFRERSIDERQIHGPGRLSEVQTVD